MCPAAEDDDDADDNDDDSDDDLRSLCIVPCTDFVTGCADAEFDLNKHRT